MGIESELNIGCASSALLYGLVVGGKWKARHPWRRGAVTLVRRRRKDMLLVREIVTAASGTQNDLTVSSDNFKFCKKSAGSSLVASWLLPAGK